MSKLCIIMTHRGRSSSLASCACWTRTCLWFSLSTSLLMYLGVKSKPTWTVTEAKRPSSLKTTLQMKARWQKCVAHWCVTSPIATSWSLCVCIKGKAASRSCVKAKKGRAIAWTTKTQKNSQESGSNSRLGKPSPSEYLLPFLEDGLNGVAYLETRPPVLLWRHFLNGMDSKAGENKPGKPEDVRKQRVSRTQNST